MRRSSFDIWGLALTTAVTLLIWYWAAGETRDSARSNTRVLLRTGGAEPWLLEPESRQVAIEISGSRRQVRAAESGLRELELFIAPEIGRNSIDLIAELRRHPDVTAAGISITAVDPPILEVRADRLMTREARVMRRLPGARLDDEVTIEPQTVAVTFPSQSALASRADLTVEPNVTREEIEALTPGSRVTLPGIGLRPVGLRTAVPGLRIEPAQVTVTVTIRSQISVLRLDAPARIQVLSPPEDEGTIEINPRVLRDVTVTAPLETIEQIQSGQAVVIAILQIKSDERARRITQKAISGFMVLYRDGRVAVIDGRVGEAGEAAPVVQITIAQPAPAG